MVLAQIFGLGPFGGVRGPGPSPRPWRAGGRRRSRTRRVKATGVRLELGVGCRRATRGWGGGSRAGGSRCDGALGGAAPSIALLSLI